MAPKKIPLVNRELSWLTFNGRVLQEAANPSVPLIERIRFLGIFSNNLDEFFRVRVATLRRLLVVEKGAKKIMGDNPRKILEKIQRIVIDYQKKFDNTFQEIIDELRKENIYLINETQLSAGQIDYLNGFFDDHISEFVAPVILKRNNKFPELVDQSIYLAVKLTNSQKPNTKEFALIEIPSRFVKRFIQLPNEGDKSFIILLDDVIRLCLSKVFKILPFDTFEAYTVKITRDAELDVDNDISESLLEKISKGVKNRKRGEPVRLVYDEKIPTDLLKFIVKGLNLDEDDYVIPGGRYHNFKDFIRFPSLGRNHLINLPLEPVSVKELDEATRIMDIMSDHDFMLHYPFHSFQYYIRLLREAALDPAVKSIHITLYRVATESRVVHALINAAQNGKKVTAIVELRARFDENANIYWSKQMQEAGVQVIFGVPGLKVHSKMTLITRQEKNKERKYAVVSTGNFHEGNANIYTDVNLFTADSRITSEILKVFTFLETNYKTFSYKHLLVAPFNMRRRLYSLIDTEIENAAKGLPAYLIGKINNLVDEEMIKKLYQASKAGVKIKLVVRGTCALVPGVKGISENIEVYGIVDRFLEHSRIFIFANGGSEVCYISSADWMTRNLDYRIEVATPIYSKPLIEEMKTVVNYALRDNVKARLVNHGGCNEFKPCKEGEPEFRSQLELYSFYQNIERHKNGEVK
ncbi:MAG: RNA degradosome polyphosphate kinase [Tenuifilum sp.]|uniref:RNA degradosome polyphosphate kinase n=1 Tax=Tenuifilum sp. TaxID=2760880 RepID=UPI001B651298|nr:RNA degradosome polyphosphate kinase [Bacteroidales bacterium]MBP9030419.1 RNA degradosome polyphosphate kinase [Bacteroidales bacterium]